jgi:hypothetical protein
VGPRRLEHSEPHLGAPVEVVLQVMAVGSEGLTAVAARYAAAAMYAWS